MLTISALACPSPAVTKYWVRKNKIPKLSDFDGDIAIAKHADKVLFLYRDEYYGKNQNKKGISTRGITKVIVAKNRNGSVGFDIELNFIWEYMTFEDIK